MKILLNILASGHKFFMYFGQWSKHFGLWFKHFDLRL